MASKNVVIPPRTDDPNEEKKFFETICLNINDIYADLIVAEADIDTAESDIDDLELWADGIDTWAGTIDTWIAVMDAVAAKTGTATLTTSERRILCSGTFTVTLPVVSGNSGKDYYIKNSGTGVITIEGNGSETIDNNLNLTLTSMESVHILCSGTAWWII